MPATHIRRGARRPRGGSREPSEWFVRASETILKIGAFVLVLSAAYMLYGIFGGHLTPESTVAGRVATVFQTCSTAFTIGAILVSTCMFIRFYDDPLIVYLGALPALLAFFGVPFLVGTQNAQDSLIARDLVKSMRLCGEIVFIIVALRASIAVADRVRRPPEPEKKADRAGKPEPEKKKGVKPPLWAKCWDLSYCHETLREVCPAYKERKSCWRIKKGCNCDEAMIDRLVQARTSGKGVSAEQQRTARAYVRDELMEPRRPRSTTQLIPCSKCPIYAEHQRQKFHIANPVLIVAAFALFYFMAPIYTTGFKSALVALDKFCAEFAFVPPSEREKDESKENEAMWHGPDWKPIDTTPFVQGRPVIPENEYRMTSWLGGELNAYTVHWIVYVVLCLFLLTQIIRVVEWAIFKMHW